MNLYLDNSNVVELRDLTNSVTGLADEGASVSLTITDQSGTAVTGETWPVSMAHVSNGLYRATLSESLSIVSGRKYFAVVSATGSGGQVGKWTCPVVAEVRRCE